LCAESPKNPWPGPAYDANALAAKAEFPRLRGGDLALPSLKADAKTGDFARVTDAKVGAEDANASKPDRLGAGVFDGELVVGARSVENFDDMGEIVDALLEEKILCPLTAANGELVEAYAMNPLCKGKL